MPQVAPYIPQRITVHLGPPDSNAANVTVGFADYVKNVASSEVYPPGRKVPSGQIFLPLFPLP